jgi:hypothetical protein
MNEVHHVHERDLCARLAVFRELIFVETRKCGAETFLQRIRNRAAVRSEVTGEDLERVIGMMHNAVVKLRRPGLAFHRVSEFARHEVCDGAHTRSLTSIERGFRGELLAADLREKLLDARRSHISSAIILIAQRAGEQERGELELCGLCERVAAGE